MKLKYIFLTIFSFCFFLTVRASNTTGNEEIKVECTIKGCAGTLQLFDFDGSTFRPVEIAKVKSDSIYTFTIPKSDPTFYYIGNEPSKVKPVILGSEPMVRLKGRCGQNFEISIEESEVNEQYSELKLQMGKLRSKHSVLAKKFRSAKSNDDRRNIAREMKELDDAKLAFLDSLNTANPYLGSIAAVNTYLSFQNNTKDYPNEILYFADQFFGHADLSDEHYNRSSWLYESMKGFVYTLTSARIADKDHLRYIEQVVEKIPEGSKARKLALSGAIVILNQRNHTNFVPLAERFVSEYKETDPAAAMDLQKQVENKKSFMIGGQAPDFSQSSPEGEEVKLSDFRGKILLVDFWASWCGPCRRENPHVVELYKKYKEQGFEILGVSLDNKKDRWTNAITSDKLEWQHVSDLKGWKNEVAKLYSVTSIPHTILLDQEGKIIARNLRGASLERKLEELFD